MRIFVDCTDTFYSGKNTGIQRVVRSFMRHTAKQGVEFGVDCIPVIFNQNRILPLALTDALSIKGPHRTLHKTLNSAYFFIARKIALIIPVTSWKNFFLAHRSEFGLAWLLFQPILLIKLLRSFALPPKKQSSGLETTLNKNDILFLPDASWSNDLSIILDEAKKSGTTVVFFVHDIIPLTHPEVCHPVHIERFNQWFKLVMRTADFLVFNSQFCRQSIEIYQKEHPSFTLPPHAVVYLGHNFSSAPSREVSHRKLRAALDRNTTNFICVGTLEPRKNIATLLDAFEILWEDSHDASLIIIGREGWMCDDVLARIENHTEYQRQLFWFNDVDDLDLVLAYRQASALIFPSLVEGFGLPLVEAQGNGLPVIASDIPVFREIAGSYARFFEPTSPIDLANTIKGHIASPEKSIQPFHWPSWEESSGQLLATLINYSSKNSATF